MALFDKTGTITEGNLRVAHIETIGSATEEELMRLAAGVEFGSGHPIAVGIVEYAKEKGLPIPEPEKVITFAGRGVSGVVEGAGYWPERAGCWMRKESLPLELPEYLLVWLWSML